MDQERKQKQKYDNANKQQSTQMFSSNDENDI
jgi:hypothetical protein